MKRILFSLSLLCVLIIGGCIKNDPVLVTGSRVEFDATTFNNPAVGLTYPILNRIPAFGTSTSTVIDSLIRRTTPAFNVRVNLVGAQRSTPTDFTYTVNAASTAVAGTHYETLSGVGTIPANSSFGFIQVTPKNTGVSSTTPVILVLELTKNSNFDINFNYSKIGLSFSQL